MLHTSAASHPRYAHPSARSRCNHFWVEDFRCVDRVSQFQRHLVDHGCGHCCDAYPVEASSKRCCDDRPVAGSRRRTHDQSVQFEGLDGGRQTPVGAETAERPVDCQYPSPSANSLHVRLAQDISLSMNLCHRIEPDRGLIWIRSLLTVERASPNLELGRSSGRG